MEDFIPNSYPTDESVEYKAPYEPDAGEKKRIRFFRDRLDLAKRNSRQHQRNWKRFNDVYLGTQELPKQQADNIQSDLKIKWAWQRWQSVSPKIMDPEPRLEFRPIEIGDQRVSDILRQLVKFQMVQDEFVSKQTAVIDDAGIKGIAPALSERLSEVISSLKGQELTVIISQSDMNHSRGLFDSEFVIERGANRAV